MKSILCYCAILIAAFAMPVERADVAQLRPIEVIYIYKDADAVVLKTDTEDVGIGTDVETALQDMKLTSPARIYLDTAEYLLIGEGAQEDAMQLKGILKNSVQLCVAGAELELKEVAKYLPVHSDLPDFQDWEAGEKLPVLELKNDRIKISKKDEKSA